jgi:putative ABC transport system substrate-binding protein
MVSDPIGSRFVTSVARPGGNITGFTLLHASIAGKYVSMLKEIMPQLARVALMYNPDSVPDSGTFFAGAFMEAAAKYEVQPIIAEVHDPAEIENTITKLGGETGSGVALVPDNFTTVHRELIISLTAQFRIPAIYPYLRRPQRGRHSYLGDRRRARREGGHHDDTHCHGCNRRPPRQWHRDESGTSGRERHGVLLARCRA